MEHHVRSGPLFAWFSFVIHLPFILSTLPVWRGYIFLMVVMATPFSCWWVFWCSEGETFAASQLVLSFQGQHVSTEQVLASWGSGVHTQKPQLSLHPRDFPQGYQLSSLLWLILGMRKTCPISTTSSFPLPLKKRKKNWKGNESPGSNILLHSFFFLRFLSSLAN